MRIHYHLYLICTLTLLTKVIEFYSVAPHSALFAIEIGRIVSPITYQVKAICSIFILILQKLHRVEFTFN